MHPQFLIMEVLITHVHKFSCFGFVTPAESEQQLFWYDRLTNTTNSSWSLTFFIAKMCSIEHG